MPLQNLVIQALQHHESDSDSHTSELTWLPTTEETFSAADRSPLWRFLCGSCEGDTLPDVDAERCDPYLKPITKEREARARRKHSNSSPKRQNCPMKKPATPDTPYDLAGDPPSLVPSDLQVPDFFSFTPPATKMIPRRVSVVEPESQPPESSMILHAGRKCSNSSPKTKSPMKDPATPDTAYESDGESLSLVPSNLQVPNFFSLTPPATIKMITRKVSIVEPESQPPESFIAPHKSKHPNSSPKKESPIEEPTTPETAYEAVGDSSSLVPPGLQVPKTIMTTRKGSVVEPESQPPESSIAPHKSRHPKSSPKRESPIKEPTTPETAYEAVSVSSSLVPPGLQVPKFSSFTPPATIKIRRVCVVEPESQLPRSSIVIHVEEEPKPKPAEKERKYWNKIADGRLVHFGIANLRTAEALMQLGSSHMRCEEYKEALTVFRTATRIFRTVNGSYDLSTAMALNKVGLAECQLNKLEPNLRNAMDALNQSFSVRYELLGPTHVDTIDTLNNMAAIHYHLQEFQEARQAYFEVWTLRELIFGPKHPSAAVTAHCLGSTHMRLGEFTEASKYYHHALDIYRDLQLSDDNPAMVRLLTDITSLGRIVSSMWCI